VFDVGNNLNYYSGLPYYSVNLKSLKIKNILLKEINSYMYKKLIFLDASFNNISSLTGFEDNASLRFKV
jgi:hypothetical protein